MTDSIYAWSHTTPSDNGAADASINFAEFANPDTVNDSARMLMTRVAQFLEDLAAQRTSTGTGSAYVVTAAGLGATLKGGEVVTFLPHADNNGAATLNAGGTGARALRARTGVALTARAIITGVPTTCIYRLASDEWLVLNSGYYVQALASGVSLQSITARLPKIGQAVLSFSPTPANGYLRLTETARAVLKSSWPELNAWLSSIGYPWGSTATHCNLPPAAGYFLRVAGNNATVDTGGARDAGVTQAEAAKSTSVPVGTLSATTSVSTTTSTTTSTSVTISPNPHSHLYGAGGVVGTGGGGQSTSTPVSGTTGAVNLTAAATSTSSSSSSSSATTNIGGSLTLPGGNEWRVKNVAVHVDILASTAAAATITAAFGFAYAWDTATANADPGAGQIRGDDASLASITQLYVSKTDGLGVDLGNVLLAMRPNTVLDIQLVTGPANRFVGRLTGSPVNNTTYVTLPVVAQASNGFFTSGSALALQTAAGAPEVEWKGLWGSSTSYSVFDAVRSDGNDYMCLVAHTSGPNTEPGVGIAWTGIWGLLAANVYGKPGIRWIETGWENAAAYQANDALYSSGGSYICTRNHTSAANTQPGVGASWTTVWDTLAVGSPGVAGTDPGLHWDFDSGTSMADPTSGNLRFNNSTLSSVTAIAISYSTGEVGNPSAAEWVKTWDDSTSTAKGTLLLKKPGETERYAIFDVTGLTDSSTWAQLTVTHRASAGALFSDGDTLSVEFQRAGDKGSDGVGSGDVTAASTFANDNRLIRSDGIGKGVQASNITVSDTNDLSGIGTISSGAITSTGAMTIAGPLAGATTIDASGTITSSGGGLSISGPIAGATTIAQSSYSDLTEIASPASPAANILRLFAKDDSGVTRLAHRDNAGLVRLVGKSTTIEVFTADGTWTKPEGLVAVDAIVVAAGGGGGGAAGAASSIGAAGGGAGGAYGLERIAAASLGATVAVTVGTGGAGGAAGNNSGAAGGTSSFGAYLSAAGGTGGVGSAAGTTVLVTPGGVPGGEPAGGSYSSGGSPAQPGIRLSGTVGIGGSGAPGPWGGGGRCGIAAADGGAATGPGAGGGGGLSNSATARAGGDGYDGIVIILEHY